MGTGKPPKNDLPGEQNRPVTVPVERLTWTIDDGVFVDSVFRELAAPSRQKEVAACVRLGTTPTSPCCSREVWNSPHLCRSPHQFNPTQSNSAGGADGFVTAIVQRDMHDGHP